MLDLFQCLLNQYWTVLVCFYMLDLFQCLLNRYWAEVVNFYVRLFSMFVEPILDSACLVFIFYTFFKFVEQYWTVLVNIYLLDFFNVC